MKIVSNFGLVMENSDILWIDTDHIIACDFGPPQPTICKLGPQIVCYSAFAYAYLEISPEADRIYPGLGHPQTQTVFKRLQECCDVTQIVSAFSDGTQDTVYLSEKAHTRCRVSDPGTLIFEVSEEESNDEEEPQET